HECRVGRAAKNRGEAHRNRRQSRWASRSPCRSTHPTPEREMAMTASRLTQSKPKSPSEVRLVEVLDAYLAAAQEGVAPSRDELLAKHPEMAEDLEACLASLEFIRQASLSAPPLVVDSKAIEAEGGEPGLGD